MEIGKENTSEVQDFLITVIGSAPYGIITIDGEGDITMINDLAGAFLDIEEQVNSVIDVSFYRFIKGINGLKKIVQDCLKNKKNFDLFEVQFYQKYLTVRGRMIKDGMIVTIQDITNIKEMETQAFNAMLEGQELERRRLSKEIHDGMGPLLSTVQLTLDDIKTDLEDSDKKLVQRFDKISDLIDTIARDMRTISHNLMPRVLDDFGLTEAFQNLAEGINSTGKMKMEFYSTLGKKRFDKNLELGLYRMGQELVNNVIKHSNTTVFSLQIILHSKSIVLVVEDSGIGIVKNENALPGIGLLNIETRAKALGGFFQIDSVKDKGVTAIVEIPV